MKIKKLISFLFVVAVLFLPQVLPAAAEGTAGQEAAEEKIDEAKTGPEYVYAVVKPGGPYGGSLAVGQKVQVSVDAFPGKTFEGTVKAVSPESAKIHIPNPGGLLLPGTFASIKSAQSSYL